MRHILCQIVLQLVVFSTLLVADEPTAVQREPVNESPSFQLKGQIKNQAGEPLSDMNVAIRVRNTRGYSFSELLPYYDVLALGATDIEGKFAFQDISIPPTFSEQIAELLQGSGVAQLIVWGTGYGMEMRDVSSFKPEEFHIDLKPADDVNGVVLQQDNVPVTGAHVCVNGWTESIDQLPPLFNMEGDLSLFRSQVQLSTTTDSRGRFQLPSIPPGKRVSIMVIKPGFVRSMNTIDTGKTGRTTIKTVREDRPLLQSPLTLTISKSPFVDVQIVDQNGGPITTGYVAIIDSEQEIVTYPGAALDKDGRATLNTRPAGKHTLIYSPDPFHPQPSLHQEFDVEEGKPTQVFAQMPPVTWVEGKVVDADTEKPLAGVSVGVFPKERKLTSWSSLNCALTQQDGSYKLPVTPGEWRIAAFGTMFGYSIPYHQEASFRPHIAREVTITGSTSVIPDKTLKLTQGLVVKGQVLTPNGQPQADVIVSARQKSQSYEMMTLGCKTDADGRFQISGLSPTTDTEFSAVKGIFRGEFSLAKPTPFDWKQAHRETVSITLKPTKLITGRLISAEKPLKNIRVDVTKGQRVPNGMRMSPFVTVVTNDEGIFEFAGLNEGDNFSLKFRVPAELQPLRWHDHLTVNDESPMKLPDVNFVRSCQVLSGQVVDRLGQPVAGITVSARLRGGFSSLRRPDNGPPPWIDTDNQGKFTLTNLPDEPIELMAYKGNPKGGTIHYPAKVNPEMNEENILILLDPTLNSPIENLDPESN